MSWNLRGRELNLRPFIFHPLKLQNVMDLGLDALSKLTVFSKYAKYVPELKRRETWEEIVARYESMMIKKYPKLEAQIKESSQFILQNLKDKVITLRQKYCNILCVLSYYRSAQLSGTTRNDDFISNLEEQLSELNTAEYTLAYYENNH